MYILKNLKTHGFLPRKTDACPTGSNAQFSIDTSDDVLIKDCEFGMDGYNCVEIALAANCQPKHITIENCHFAGSLSNNAISIFDTAEDAEILVKNCTFDQVSNPFRLSNKSNSSCKMIIEDCTFINWEPTPNYAGLCLFQDYTSPEGDLGDNLAKFSNIEVHLNNLTMPEYYGLKNEDGKLSASSKADICGTKALSSQLFYLYRDNQNPKLLECTEETISQFPQHIFIDGVELA